jgi:hypothetical protein
MNAVKGRWGFYPCEYETYLKLKRIKKRYWETVYAETRYNRWERKLPKNRKGPEPIFCPLVGNRVWGWRMGNIPESPYPVRIPTRIANKTDQAFLDWFESARRPLDEDLVKPFTKSQIDLINEAYDKIERWFTGSEAAA